jgi:hypothetical protein
VTVNQGVEVPVTYHYTLTDVADGEYSIEATLDADFDVEEDGLSATGTMTGSGTLTGAVDNPLVTSSSFDVAMEMASDADDFSMNVEISIDLRAAAPAS